MSWCIVADSSCNLRSFDIDEGAQAEYRFVPLKITVGGREFVDDAQLDVDELNRAVSQEKSASSSSCPSAGEWAEQFRRADKVIAITISGALSGSHEAAVMAQRMVLDEDAAASGSPANRRLHVQDSRAAGGKLEVMVELLARFIAKHDPSFDEAVSFLQDLEDHAQVLFSLSSYDNLVKNGRMPRLAGAIASKLSIRMLGTASEEGKIKVIGPTRGERKMIRKTIDQMRNDGYQGGLVYIDHVANPQGAGHLRDAIVEAWPEARVRILPCSGLCSYYAESTGLIIGFEWCDAARDLLA
ncbi:MAG: DegV family protein [Collinsella sp.]|nr:DegV family protein [Collinsella sp.]